MVNLRKPKIKKDWDINRRVVTNAYGEEFVLFKPEAQTLYKAAMGVYKKRKRR